MHGQPAHPGLGDRNSPWPVVAAVFVGCWTVAVTVATQTGGWLTDQVLLGFGRDRVGWLWPVLGLTVVVLVGTPALLLVGALVLGVLTALRVVPPVHHEVYLAALAAAASLSALTVAWSARRSSGSNVGTAPDATAPWAGDCLGGAVPNGDAATARATERPATGVDAAPPAAG